MEGLGCQARAAELGDKGTNLAARLPVVREAVVDELIRLSARKNALVAAAVFVPGVDLPVLTLNQMRLVLRIAAAHDVEISNDRLPELLAVLGGALAQRETVLVRLRRPLLVGRLASADPSEREQDRERAVREDAQEERGDSHANDRNGRVCKAGEENPQISCNIIRNLSPGLPCGRVLNQMRS